MNNFSVDSPFTPNTWCKLTDTITAAQIAAAGAVATAAIALKPIPGRFMLASCQIEILTPLTLVSDTTGLTLQVGVTGGNTDSLREATATLVGVSAGIVLAAVSATGAEANLPIAQAATTHSVLFTASGGGADLDDVTVLSMRVVQYFFALPSAF